METIAAIVRIEVWALLIGAAAIVLLQMVSGGINTSGLLNEKDGTNRLSPARLQLFVATITVAFYYIGEVMTATETGKFPTVPNELMLMLAGSHAFYLGSKTVSMAIDTLGLSKNKTPKS